MDDKKYVKVQGKYEELLPEAQPETATRKAKPALPAVVNYHIAESTYDNNRVADATHHLTELNHHIGEVIQHTQDSSPTAMFTHGDAQSAYESHNKYDMGAALEHVKNVVTGLNAMEISAKASGNYDEAAATKFAQARQAANNYLSTFNPTKVVRSDKHRQQIPGAMSVQLEEGYRKGLKDKYINPGRSAEAIARSNAKAKAKKEAMDPEARKAMNKQYNTARLKVNETKYADTRGN